MADASTRDEIMAVAQPIVDLLSSPTEPAKEQAIEASKAAIWLVAGFLADLRRCAVALEKISSITVERVGEVMRAGAPPE